MYRKNEIKGASIIYGRGGGGGLKGGICFTTDQGGDQEFFWPMAKGIQEKMSSPRRGRDFFRISPDNFFPQKVMC